MQIRYVTLQAFDICFDPDLTPIKVIFSRYPLDNFAVDRYASQLLLFLKIIRITTSVY